MNITVAKALHIQPLNRCVVAGGHRGLSRGVRSVTIMDSPDTSWLKAGELLLTTGFVFKDDIDAQVRVIQDLHDQQCAGLGIKEKRFLPEIPKLMIKEADRLDFPLFTIPYDMTLSDMILALTQEIINEQRHLTKQAKREEYFSGLLTGSLSETDLILNQGKAYGLSSANEYVVYCLKGISLHNISEDRLQQIISKAGAAANERLISIKLDDHVAVIQVGHSKDLLMQTPMPNGTASLIVKHFAEDIDNERITIGIGKYKQDVCRIHESYKEAKEAVFLGGRIMEGEMIFNYAALEADALLQHLPDVLLERYLTSTLAPLIKYDTETGSNLMYTLEVYLSLKGHIGEIARSMYIHRNTVKFRITRIEELLGVDLTGGDTIFRLGLALRVAHLLGLPVSQA
ncbi:PucR-like helix-turn-helix protein [Scopulibacillus darangshiensis]|uniref:PucR-like helix-turn-helix protein n=1 Tax=Scopulibacillus darangshiensis TaxID=442528 RepID=A0A4R2NJK9_9BACL|nr:PucR family transcriptional regulator [Scopulibacillus darangshiensis]TCP21657.1 PucR-like helix-turn-helix protein [Scopulibacillus darangshiensis]